MTDYPPPSLVAVALLRRLDDVLLVSQQGPADEQPNWALPGGVVKHGETLIDALHREVREETGLTITNPGRLLYVTQLDDRVEGRITLAHVFQMKAWLGDTLQAGDPDDLIREVRFFPVGDAVTHLYTLPWSFMRDPAIAALQDPINVTEFWLYQRTSGTEIDLIARYPTP